MDISMGIFFGSSTGNTEMAAEKIKEQLGQFVSECVDVSKLESAEAIANHDLILFGVSTWNIGEMQDDWADFIPKMDGLDLTGKKVCFFAMGDSIGYPYNFLDAMGELWGVVQKLGTPKLIGVWPTEDYEFDESQAMFDENHFIGLGLDEDNDPEKTDDRIRSWLIKVMQDAGLIEVA